jgi:hypothetical protein
MSKPTWDGTQWTGDPPRRRGRPSKAGSVLVQAHYRRTRGESVQEPQEELPPSTLRWEAAARAKAIADGDSHGLRDLERIVTEHRRWLKQQRDERGVCYSLDENNELQITMSEEWSDKVSDAVDSGEIIELPKEDSRAIYSTLGAEGRYFGWEDGREKLERLTGSTDSAANPAGETSAGETKEQTPAA